MARIDRACVAAVGEVVQTKAGLAIAPGQFADVGGGEVADGGVAVALQGLAEHRTDPGQDAYRPGREHIGCL